MNEQQPRDPGRMNSSRRFWVLGFAIGIMVGTAAAFGIVGAQGLPHTETVR